MLVSYWPPDCGVLSSVDDIANISTIFFKVQGAGGQTAGEDTARVEIC